MKGRRRRDHLLAAPGVERAPVAHQKPAGKAFKTVLLEQQLSDE
jgi:hypothetical protein